jgi:predicted DNA-binding transcriptional regulator YafY
VRWRDNWYLDAWCHSRCALRTFALDAIAIAQVLPQPARKVGARALRAQFLPGYGIFSGRAPRHA